MLGAGRVGSILGPTAGGVLLSLKWSVPAIFLLVAVAGLLWAAAMCLLIRMPRNFQ